MSANPFFNPTQYARPAGTPSQAWFDAHNLGAGGAQNLSSAAGGGAAQGPASYGGWQPRPEPTPTDYQPQIDQMRTRLGQLRQRAGAGGAGPKLQARIDELRGNVQDTQQAKSAQNQQQQGGGAQPEPAMMMGGGFGGQQMNAMAQYFGQLPPGFGQGPQGSYGVGGMGMGGGMPQYGGMNYGGGMQSWMQQPMMYGGYNQSMGGNQTGLAEQGQMPTGAQRPGMQYRQDRRQARQGGNEMAQAGQPQGGAPSWYEAGSFDTPFGNLVQSSVGNGNIYKQNGSDGQSLYHYDPNVGWKHMTQQEYMGYNNPADFYQDPNQYAAAAGGNKSQMQMKNGMYQTMLGTGTYR